MGLLGKVRQKIIGIEGENEGLSRRNETIGSRVSGGTRNEEEKKEQIENRSECFKKNKDYTSSPIKPEDVELQGIIFSFFIYLFRLVLPLVKLH